jgi:hypothetical protein
VRRTHPQYAHAMTDTQVEKKPSAPRWEIDARDSIRKAIRRFAKPLQEIVARDANEGDTRLLVTDFLCEGLGFDKFEDLSTEFAVRGEFADYGVRIDKQLVAFIEVKRAAQKLGVKHLRQVETYAVKEGLEWLILTNGQSWQAYHTYAKTGQQVATHLVLDVDILGDAPIAQKIDDLFYLHRIALKRGRIDELWKRKAATSAVALSDVLLTDSVIGAVRKEIRRTSGYNPEPTELVRIIRNEVVRPDLLVR